MVAVNSPQEVIETTEQVTMKQSEDAARVPIAHSATGTLRAVTPPGTARLVTTTASEAIPRNKTRTLAAVTSLRTLAVPEPPLVETATTPEDSSQEVVALPQLASLTVATTAVAADLGNMVTTIKADSSRTRIEAAAQLATTVVNTKMTVVKPAATPPSPTPLVSPTSILAIPTLNPEATALLVDEIMPKLPLAEASIQ